MSKAAEYEKAMDDYHRSFFYQHVGVVVSAVVVVLQFIALASVPWSWGMVSAQYLACFIVAYLATDFINGFVHMWMDNNNDYTSAIGPLVAVFHLHHKRPRYQSHHPLVIYFFESGSKNWLVVYLALVIVAQWALALPAALSFTLALVGILSSVAELSHYWCHNSKHPVIRGLQRVGLLLSPEHHAVHHAQDNTHYAFLNGATDPVLNFIAKRAFAGYQNLADVHASGYTGVMNANRDDT
jgi:hypothetical protein